MHEKEFAATREDFIRRVTNVPIKSPNSAQTEEFRNVWSPFGKVAVSHRDEYHNIEKAAAANNCSVDSARDNNVRVLKSKYNPLVPVQRDSSVKSERKHFIQPSPSATNLQEKFKKVYEHSAAPASHRKDYNEEHDRKLPRSNSAYKQPFHLDSSRETPKSVDREIANDRSQYLQRKNPMPRNDLSFRHNGINSAREAPPIDNNAVTATFGSKDTELHHNKYCNKAAAAEERNKRLENHYKQLESLSKLKKELEANIEGLLNSSKSGHHNQINNTLNQTPSQIAGCMGDARTPKAFYASPRSPKGIGHLDISPKQEDEVQQHFIPPKDISIVNENFGLDHSKIREEKREMSRDEIRRKVIIPAIEYEEQRGVSRKEKL